MLLVVERITIRKLLDLFLISTLPLIYSFPFSGSSDGLSLLPKSLVFAPQHLKSLKKILYPMTMFPRGDRSPSLPRAVCCHRNNLSYHRKRQRPSSDPLIPLTADFLTSVLPPVGASAGVRRVVILECEFVWVS